MPDFGQVVPVDVRLMWPNEARDFTPWLAENLKRLGDALGMDLELVSREAPVGDFSLDLVARDLSVNQPVIIENQFGSTNHDHLGKLVTYSSGLRASAVIWVAETIRDEHRKAVEWLNEIAEGRVRFFAVEVEVFRIDSSRPVVVFKPTVTPNEWQRQIQESAERAPSPRAEAYRRFFQTLIDELREKHAFTAARVAQAQNWYAFSSGIPGVTYSMSFPQDGRIRAEVYIDQGDAARTKDTFDRLQGDRSAIEAEFGEPLEWERLEKRRASRIAAYRSGDIEELSPEELYQALRWGIDHLVRFKKVFGPRLVTLTKTGIPRSQP